MVFYTLFLLGDQPLEVFGKHVNRPLGIIYYIINIYPSMFVQLIPVSCIFNYLSYCIVIMLVILLVSADWMQVCSTLSKLVYFMDQRQTQPIRYSFWNQVVHLLYLVSLKPRLFWPFAAQVQLEIHFFYVQDYLLCCGTQCQNLGVWTLGQITF